MYERSLQTFKLSKETMNGIGDEAERFELEVTDVSDGGGVTGGESRGTTPSLRSVSLGSPGATAGPISPASHHGKGTMLSSRPNDNDDIVNGDSANDNGLFAQPGHQVYGRNSGQQFPGAMGGGEGIVGISTPPDRGDPRRRSAPAGTIGRLGLDMSAGDERDHDLPRSLDGRAPGLFRCEWRGADGLSSFFFVYCLLVGWSKGSLYFLLLYIRVCVVFVVIYCDV